MDVFLKAEDCSKKLGVSITSFQEIKYRLGYKGQHVTMEIFKEIEEIVEDIKKHEVPVTAWYINRYWEIEMGKNSL